MQTTKYNVTGTNTGIEGKMKAAKSGKIFVIFIEKNDRGEYGYNRIA